MADLIDKVPPQSIEAEMAVLGSMIIEKEAVAKALEIIDEQHFYRDTHRRIFRIIKRLYLENIPIDTVSIIEELKRENILLDVGGAAYIAQLINTVSTAANVEYYAKAVYEKAILRQLIHAGTQIVEAGYKATDKPEALLDKAEQIIFSIARLRDSQGFSPARDLVQSTLERIESLMTDRKNVTGLSTGFTELDNMTSGLQPSNLIIVAGRPSMGKTSFCMNIVANVAIRNKLPVGIFSLEMSKDELMFRLICSEAWANAHEVRRGVIAKNKWPSITTAADRIYNAQIYVDDTPNLSALEVRMRARRLVSQLQAEGKKLAVIVIDYLQLLRATEKAESRQQEISEISRALKALSKELQIPVVAVSQLSRKPEERGREGRPQLSDLRESGALEQDADLVIFIYRPEIYKPDDRELEGKANIIVAKQRNGPTGDIEMMFFKEFTRFEKLEKAK
ncbi:MAG: replicative DNA helicase [Elusimicrobiota bacterium]|nr:replicative DNA helicase [Elusimicrobiota bacterium]